MARQKEKQRRSIPQSPAAQKDHNQPPLNTKVALLGAGKMGGTLLQSFLRNGLFRPENIIATVQHADVIGAAKTRGLIDNKVVAFSAAQTSLRFTRAKVAVPAEA